ncbi:MAG: RDD family protein [Chitinophagaceae bacterium]|nr:RDD family protein [Chitinophagaceae bacterium]
MEQTEIQEQHLLINFEESIVRAAGGKRFVNYIIDTIFFYILLFCIGILVAVVSPAAIESLDNNTGYGLIEQMIVLVFYVLFMFAQEAFFKGKSFGKLITGTRAVNLDGSGITLRTAMLRALSRAVPFDGFSALGSPSNPRHDKWTKTMVMDEKRSTTFNL